MPEKSAEIFLRRWCISACTWKWSQQLSSQLLQISQPSYSAHLSRSAGKLNGVFLWRESWIKIFLNVFAPILVCSFKPLSTPVTLMIGEGFTFRLSWVSDAEELWKNFSWFLLLAEICFGSIWCSHFALTKENIFCGPKKPIKLIESSVCSVPISAAVIVLHWSVRRIRHHRKQRSAQVQHPSDIPWIRQRDWMDWGAELTAHPADRCDHRISEWQKPIIYAAHRGALRNQNR